MITCLAPTCAEESVQTLSYATRALKIKNKPMKNLSTAQMGRKSMSPAKDQAAIEQRQIHADIEKSALEEENAQLKQQQAEQEMMLLQMQENPVSWISSSF